MNLALLAAGISGLVSIVVVVVSYLLTKRKEHEADWRKLKLERYGEYVAALSGVVRGEGPKSEAQARCADAVNGIALVAPAPVLAALYAFQAERGVGPRRDELLNALMNALRRDINPGTRHRSETVAIRFMGVLPSSANPIESSSDRNS